MVKKIVGMFCIVALAATSLWFFSRATAAPNLIDFVLIFAKDFVSASDPKFKADIVLERTEGSGTPPFTVLFPIPSGASLDGNIGDILVDGDKNAQVSLKGDVVTIAGGDLGSARIQIQVPLIFETCPNQTDSCKLTGEALLKDSKDQEASAKDTINGTILKAIPEDDFALEITSPGDVPANQRKVAMQYQRTPGTGLNPFIMTFVIPDGTKVVGKPTVEHDSSNGFDGKSVGNTFQFEGEVDEKGSVRVSFLLEVSGCPSGALDCIISYKASLADNAASIVINHEEQYFKAPSDLTGALGLSIIMIGEGQNRDIELTLKRDGGEGEQTGEIKLLLPTVNAVDPGTIKVQSFNSDVGAPTKDGQFIIWPVKLNPDSIVKIGMETVIDTSGCTDPECKDQLAASYDYSGEKSVQTTAGFTYEDMTQVQSANVTLGLLTGTPVINPGDEVEVAVYIQEIPSGRMPGKYGFLLEGAGMKTTGDINVTTTNASPDKVSSFFSENGYRSLKWEGEIGANGDVSVNVKAVADACKNGASCSADARLTVILPDGTEMVVKESILIEDDSGFDPDEVQFKAAFLPTGETALQSFDDFNKLPIEGACMTECEEILMGVENSNSDPAEVFVRITAVDQLKIGPPVGHKLTDLGLNKDKGTHSYQLRLVSQPGETVSFPLPVDVNPSIIDLLEGNDRFSLEISTCAQPIGSDICKSDLAEEKVGNERSPQNLLLLYLIWRARDFGDAPNVNNHFGVLMEAYGPGTALAHYPLGRDPSILNPPPNQIKGPGHRLSTWFHLGAGVTPEFAIDRSWDSDFTNNIEPSVGPNANDFDGADDGIDISAITFDNCNSITIPVDVTITPAIITFFTNNDADGLAHINMWLDSDRDGRWGNGPGLCVGSTNEHIVIDHSINPVALGVGTHTVMVPTGIVEWPQAFGLPDEPAWLRLMLTPVESNKDLYVTYGDGRGEDFIYFGGETEDYYYVAPSAVSSSSSPYTADMTLDVDLIHPGTNAKEEVLEFPGIDKADGQMVIRFRNDGFKPAEGLIIDGDFGPATAIIFGKITNLKCDGCTSSDPKGLGTGKVSWAIDKLNPGEFGEIILGWTGCLTCVRSIEKAAATATIMVSSKQDFRPLNNVVSLKWPPINRLAPRIELGWTGCLTCVRSVEDTSMTNGYVFKIVADDVVVNRKYKPYYDGAGNHIAENLPLCEGIPCKELELPGDGDVGISRITFTTVDSNGQESPHSNPLELGCVDDIVRGSLIFIDQESGKQFRVPAKAHEELNASIIGIFPSRSYKMLVAYCGDDPDPKISLTIGSKTYPFKRVSNNTYLGGALGDEKGPQATETSIIMSVESNGTTYEDAFTAEEPAGAHVISASGSKPVLGAKILVLEERSVEFGDETITTMVPWASSSPGQDNPLTTGADGSYEISVPNGNYQIVVIADGYQTYRSTVLEVTNYAIAQEVQLVEARPAPSNIDISVNESGFGQTVIQVKEGWVVKFINSGTSMHGASSVELGESSGLMTPGESFKMAFDTAGIFEITDPANGNRVMIVQVVSGASTIYLPLIIR
jgi:plastocyanin